MNSPSLSAAILAGGKSRRMGQSKALLEIDGIPVIDRVAQVLRQITSELLIIVSLDASPITDNGYEPLCAIYTQSCLPVIKSRIERNQLSVRQLFTDLRIYAFSEWREVDPTGNAFLNMNTPTDYEIAKQLLSRQSEVGI